tara:strand:- start:408 stop:575 length:168 start_codon:yes stop_codon:yes gene_type:complete
VALHSAQFCPHLKCQKKIIQGDPVKILCAKIEKWQLLFVPLNIEKKESIAPCLAK